ncbi:MarR family transcriptional regulator, partial [Streptococcus suis]
LLENNILNRQVRITDKIRNQISSEKFADLTEHEKHILHLAHNSGKITSVEVASFIGKSRPYATSLLKKLTNEGLLTWHGASPKDPTQYYSFNHSFE